MPGATLRQSNATSRLAAPHVLCHQQLFSVDASSIRRTCDGKLKTKTFYVNQKHPKIAIREVCELSGSIRGEYITYFIFSAM